MVKLESEQENLAKKVSKMMSDIKKESFTDKMTSWGKANENEIKILKQMITKIDKDKNIDSFSLQVNKMECQIKAGMSNYRLKK